MSELDHTALARALLPVVLAAGRIEMSYFSADVLVETKQDASPVTAADREAEAVILRALATIAPDIPVIAEEAASSGKIPQIGERFFLVDPLDGTAEFIHQRDEFTVNIALIVDNKPVFGIIYAPALAELYVTLGPGAALGAQIRAAEITGDTVAAITAASAAELAGAAANGSLTLENCGLIPLRCRRMDRRALSALVSRSHGNEQTETFLADYKIAQRISAGSSLKFCVMARGDGDIYPRLAPTMEWDIAAGHAILNAAGGRVGTLDGSPLQYGKADQGFKNPPFVAWGRE